MTGIWRLRAAVLTVAAALVVHHGRYLFAAPGHEHELAGAHAYLPWLAPLSAVALFLVVVQLVAYLGRARDGASPELPSARALWLAGTVTLLGVFTAQESLETLFSHGRLPELTEILGAGGWTALPLAFAAGGAAALLLRGAAQVVRWALSRGTRRARWAPPALLLAHPPATAPRRSVMARKRAGRAPPVLFLST